MEIYTVLSTPDRSLFHLDRREWQDYPHSSYRGWGSDTCFISRNRKYVRSNSKSSCRITISRKYYIREEHNGHRYLSDAVTMRKRTSHIFSTKKKTYHWNDMMKPELYFTNNLSFISKLFQYFTIFAIE